MTRDEYWKEVNAAFAKGDYGQARQIGEAMVRDGIHNGYFQMAGADRLMGNLSQAEEEIKTYLAESDDADGWLQYGMIRFASGDYLKAAEFYDKSAERGSNKALGFAAVSRYTYANMHVNDDPNNVDKNLLLFDLMEKAIVQSVQCIQKDPRDYDSYGLIPNMIYVDYSMVAAGWTSYTHVDQTSTNLYGTTERKSFNSYAGTSGTSLWEMNESLNNQENFTERQKVACKNRAAKIAQILREVGKEAEASMVMFEMLFAEVTLDGKNSSAPKAASYYTQALETARASLSDEAYKAWVDDFQDCAADYLTLMQKNGKRIKEAQENGGQTKIEKAKNSFSPVGIIYAIGTMPFISWVLTLAGGLMAMFGRTSAQDGNPIGMVGLLVFGLIFVIIGIVLGVRNNLNANPHCLRAGALVVFILSFFHIIAGIAAVVVAKILAGIWK